MPAGPSSYPEMDAYASTENARTMAVWIGAMIVFSAASVNRIGGPLRR